MCIHNSDSYKGHAFRAFLTLPIREEEANYVTVDHHPKVEILKGFKAKMKFPFATSMISKPIEKTK